MISDRWMTIRQSIDNSGKLRFNLRILFKGLCYLENLKIFLHFFLIINLRNEKDNSTQI